MTKVTWWIEPLPSKSIEVLNDQALLDTLKMTMQLNRLLVRGGDLPAVGRMWEGNPVGLQVYGMLLCLEANHKRGLDADFFQEFAQPARKIIEEGGCFAMPPWHQDEDVHISHIAAIEREGLWRSDEHRIELDEEDEFWPVLWPVATESGGYELMVNKKDREAMAVDDLWLPDEVRARVVNL